MSATSSCAPAARGSASVSDVAPGRTGSGAPAAPAAAAESAESAESAAESDWGFNFEDAINRLNEGQEEERRRRRRRDEANKKARWCTQCAVQVIACALLLALLDGAPGPVLGQSTTLWLRDQSAFTNLRYLAIDPLDGDDSACNSVDALAAGSATALRPCRSIGRAVQLIDGPNAWLQLLGGATHLGGDLQVEHSGVTFSSSPPSTLSDADVAAAINCTLKQRMAASNGSLPLWDCTGSTHCVRSNRSELHFSGIAFTGAAEHAIVQLQPQQSNGTAAANATLPLLTIRLSDCSFTHIGGMLRMDGGSAEVHGCTMSHAISHPAVIGLLQLSETHLLLNRSSFRHNHFPLQPVPIRSCVLVSAVQTAITVHVESSMWDSNSALLSYHERVVRGGVGLAVSASSLTFVLTNSTFRNQSISGNVLAVGGAVAVHTLSSVAERTAEVTLLDNEFDGNSVGTRGYGACVAIGELIGLEKGHSAPTVVVQRNVFKNSFALGASGGGLHLGMMRSLLLSDTVFNNCSGTHAGALSIRQGTVMPIFVQRALRIARCRFTNNRAARTGGSAVIDAVTTGVEFSSCHFVNSSAAVSTGGSVHLLASQLRITVDFGSCSFVNSEANRGGAIFASSVQLSVYSTTFSHTYAHNDGGAITAESSIVELYDVHVSDSHLLPRLADSSLLVMVRGGGAIRAISGSLVVQDSSFVRCTAAPFDGDFGSCALSFSASTGLCTDGLSGVLSTEMAPLVVTSLLEATFTNQHAFSGGVFAVDAAAEWNALETRVTNTSAVAEGGTVVASSSPRLILRDGIIINSTVTQGDGGVIWSSDSSLFDIRDNQFVDSTAPAGAGGVLFSLTDGVHEPYRIDAEELGNVVSMTDASAPVALFGPVHASNVVRLHAPNASIDIFPGQNFADESNPVLVSVFAIDAYGQTMTSDRALIVQVDVIPMGADETGSGSGGAAISGSPLQRVSAADGAATFQQLRIAALPGAYTLKFALVSQPKIGTAIALRVSKDCPSGLYLDRELQSCMPCQLDFLVYNATAQSCQPCPAGQQVTRSAVSNATAGAVACQLCPLGSMSASGSDCASCGLNAYQPTPAAPCQRCTGIDGLQCAGSGLAEVQPGYFAFSVWDEAAGGPRIRTHPCPDGFCSGGFVQQQQAEEGQDGNDTHSASILQGADSAALPSAISRFDQCAYPRLAAEHNILCGECADGHIPWGSKCVRCDHADGGMLALLLFLSLLLVAYLLRSALGSSSAGHSVVVLYFVQTAMLEVGSASKLLGWLNIALFSPNSTGRCIAPLSSYQQTQAQIVMPLFLFAELMAVAGLHFLVFKRWAAIAQAEGRAAAAKGASLMSRLRASTLHLIGAFSPDIYISASLSLLLFSYTQVAAACLGYLACVDVGGVSVVFSQPSMRCDSAEYRRTLVLVILALAVYVAGFPLSVLLFLWRRSDLVRESHGLIVASAKEKAEAANGVSTLVAAEEGVDVGSISDSEADDSASASSSPSPSTAAAAHFLRRYSPLFSMYSSSAWFWQVFVLVRRTVFVAVSVTLVQSEAHKNLSFSLAHLASLLLQLHFRPFQASFYNGAEFAFHILLIIISMTLSVYLSPRSDGPQLVLFLLIVPPLCVYAVAAVASRFFSMRSDRARIFAAKMAEQLQAEKNHSARSPLADISIELSDRPSTGASASAAGGIGAAQLDCDRRTVVDDSAEGDVVHSSTQAL